MSADVDRKFYSQHMNALAVLYYIVPEEKLRELMLRVLEDPGMFEEFSLGQIRRWKDLLSFGVFFEILKDAGYYPFSDSSDLQHGSKIYYTYKTYQIVEF